jgi:membrane protein implicated in regulation of membrane protease activity
MIILVALTVGLVWWIAAWAFGIKSFDAFLLTALAVVTAGTVMLLRPFVDRLRGREAPPREESGAF